MPDSCSGTRLGKTHLIHAIGNLILAENPGKVSSFACPSVWEIETDRGATHLTLKGEEGQRADFDRRAATVDKTPG